MSLIAFPLTPKHVTLNDLEWPFCVKLFCAGMFGALKPLFRSSATLILVVNVVGDCNRKRIAATSRGFLATARLSCADNKLDCNFSIA